MGFYIFRGSRDYSSQIRIAVPVTTIPRSCAVWGCENTGTVQDSIGHWELPLICVSACEHNEWDRLLFHIMRTIRATPHKITGEMLNFLKLGRDIPLPKDLLLFQPCKLDISVNDYALQLQHDMAGMGD